MKPPSRKWRALLFDLDGTLVDSLRDIAASLDQAMEACGLPLRDPAWVRAHVGRGAAFLVEAAVGPDAGEDLRRQALEAFVRHYEAHPCTWTRPYPGVPETLAGLSARGLDLAVLSNKPAAIARRVVEILDLAPHFRHVWGGESFPRRKPAPDGIRHFLDELGLAPRQACMVGDSTMDMECAAAAGVWSCYCTGGYGDAETLAVPVDFRIRRFPELLAILDGQE